MKREDFLARVRAAARAGQAYHAAVKPIDEQAGYVGGGTRPAEQFCREVADVGGRPQLTGSWDEAGAAIDHLLDQLGPSSALCWEHPVLERLDVAGRLRRRGIVGWSHGELQRLPADRRRQNMLAAELGISSVTWAVAELGAVALAAAPGRERSVSLLPPVYLTLVHSSQLVPDLFDLFAELVQAGGDRLPSQLSLIAGPSKTGDIELQLTTGVHGPRVWHVIVVETADRDFAP